MPSCILYFCKSDPKKFKKDYVQVSNEFTITFNKDVDIMDPVFRFSKNVSALNFNYLFVPALDNRNYWVTSPPVYKAGYWEVKCHVDVIESWKNQIKNCSGIIRRAGYNSGGKQFINQYLSDDKFKAYQPPAIRTIGFSPENANVAFSENRTEFLLCVVGNNTPDPEPEPEPSEGGGNDEVTEAN